MIKHMKQTKCAVIKEKMWPSGAWVFNCSFQGDIWKYLDLEVKVGWDLEEIIWWNNRKILRMLLMIKIWKWPAWKRLGADMDGGSSIFANFFDFATLFPDDCTTLGGWNEEVEGKIIISAVSWSITSIFSFSSLQCFTNQSVSLKIKDTVACIKTQHQH